MAALESYGTVLRTALVYALVLLEVNGRLFDPYLDRHDLFQGTRDMMDNLAIHDAPFIRGKFMMVQSNQVCYPRPGEISAEDNMRFSIRGFNVTDRMPEKRGGSVSINSGGLDMATLCLKFTTQRGEGYSFVVDIWGRRVSTTSG